MLWKVPICINMGAITIFFTLQVFVVVTTRLAQRAEQSTKSRSAARPRLPVDSYVPWHVFNFRSLSLTVFEVDKTGTACTNGGGTVVLESHGTVYGPGGQWVLGYFIFVDWIIYFPSLRGVYTDPTLGPVLYYHYVDTTVGYADWQKLFGWNKINFSSGWPVV